MTEDTETVAIQADGVNVLTLADLARLAGVQPATLRKYRQRRENGLPRPDVVRIVNKAHRLLWYRTTVQPWLDARAAVVAAAAARAQPEEPVPPSPLQVKALAWAQGRA
jgi:hypothetical protein